MTGELELKVAPGRVEHLVPAGTSFWGSVHRGRDSGRWYRLVPVSRIPLEGRSQVQSWVGRRPHPSVAPIAEAHQVVAGGWFAIRYDLRVEHTLAEVPAGTARATGWSWPSASWRPSPTGRARSAAASCPCPATSP